jgi:hypothetical protein
MHKMRGVLKKEAPFVKGFKDKRNIPLLEISYAAMDEFRAAT